jgi:ABC-type phosphate/phosphonate transport system substrate-binding protein
MRLVAALPMYDWPERHAEVDAEWAAIRDALRAAGVDAPRELTRGLDERDVWRRPDLLMSQTCWGPMELGLAEHVQIVGQPSYDGIEGGEGEHYSSAIVMRALSPTGTARRKREGKGASLPLELLRDARLAYNSTESMSGLIGLTRDLEALGEGLDIFADKIETGGHRNSIKAIAEGRADVAAIDCRSWHLAQLYEPAAREVQIVGWTALRKGLPFITAKTTPEPVVSRLREILAA